MQSGMLSSEKHEQVSTPILSYRRPIFSSCCESKVEIGVASKQIEPLIQFLPSGRDRQEYVSLNVPLLEDVKIEA